MLPDDLNTLKVPELKDELKNRGQPVAGKKAELVARLQAYIAEHEVRVNLGRRDQRGGQPAGSRGAITL
jgi:hypothetical protein